MISMIDSDMGCLLNLFKVYGIVENIFVFFCFDNGVVNWYEGLFDSFGLLWGCKCDMYEGGICILMIVWMLGSVLEGKVSDYLWYFLDVLFILVVIVGIEVLKDIDGMNIVLVLFGEDFLVFDCFLYWEFYEKGFDQVVCWKNWKVVWYGLNGKLELYNFIDDLMEINDVSWKNKKIIKIIEIYFVEVCFFFIYWLVGKVVFRDQIVCLINLKWKY